MRDGIFMIDPERGHVVIILDAPGPFPWGLSWKDDHLVISDYQHDLLYETAVKDDKHYKTSEPRRAIVDFTTEAVVMGAGSVESLDIYYAVPRNRPNQEILNDISFSPEPARYEKDQWDQKIAVFGFNNLESASSVRAAMRVELETSAIRYFIYPEDVDDEIPSEIKSRYLADDLKYDINNPYIQKLVKEIIGDETALYWKARKLFQYLIANMEYKLAGGWNTAPTVLKRKNGSCSEYSFSYIALCRAAGIPARYVGSLVVRGDDASYDEVFHRWCEIYLPGYGWIPVDANAGDKELPADQAAAFGGISNRFLVTTEGGGNSKYLGWGYNSDSKLVTSGKCRVHMESIAEWEPLEGEE
jgi:transglutaminase-like putative cysteine protease